MRSLISLLRIFVTLSITAASSFARTEPPVFFHLVVRSPVISSIKDLSFYFVSTRRGTGSLAVHSAEWEVRDADRRRMIAWLPVEQNFYANNGTPDERPHPPEGSHPGFGPDALWQLRLVTPGHYRMALLINGRRASNVIAFTIDPSFDVTKAPIVTAGMIEAAPGEKAGSLLAWIVGPTPEDPEFTNLMATYPDIWVDGLQLKREGISWVGPVYPYPSGKPDVVLYLSEYALPGIDLSKPHDFQIKVEGDRSFPLVPLVSRMQKQTEHASDIVHLD
jgi:hypothetical protein